MALCTVVVFLVALLGAAVRAPGSAARSLRLRSAAWLTPASRAREIADSVLDLIGNTPLVRLKRISEVERHRRACWR